MIVKCLRFLFYIIFFKFKMPFNSRNNINNNLMPLPPTRFNCFTGEENALNVPSVLPINSQLPMESREVKIKFNRDGISTINRTKRVCIKPSR